MAQVFQQVLRFFGTIATALTGLGAVCTAAGFLAERTRWSMLGFGAPMDLNEYLFTGARFLAFLPGIIVTSVLTAAAASVTAFLVAVAMLLAVLAARRVARARGARLRDAVIVRGWTRRLRPWGLVALAILQFAGALVLFQPGILRNILFTERTALAGAECGQGRLDLEAEVLLGCEEELLEHMGRAFLIVIASGGALWFLLPQPSPRARNGSGNAPPARDEDGTAPPASEPATEAPLPAALIAVNVALLGVQLILLPINYGALFLPNEFSVVEVRLEEPELRQERWPEDGRFSLLHRRDDEFYLYAASARRIWLVPREQIRTLVYLGICGVFELDDCRSDASPLHTLEGPP